MLTKRCEYGIRAAMYLATLNAEGFTTIREISQKTAIPGSYLTKVLQDLTLKGILLSFRGPHGGVRLKRPPDQVNLKEIVEAIDGSRLFAECILGLTQCGEEKPCPVHENWSEVRGCLTGVLSTVTLQDAVKSPGAVDILCDCKSADQKDNLLYLKNT